MGTRISIVKKFADNVFVRGPQHFAFCLMEFHTVRAGRLVLHRLYIKSYDPHGDVRVGWSSDSSSLSLTIRVSEPIHRFVSVPGSQFAQAVLRHAFACGSMFADCTPHFSVEQKLGAVFRIWLGNPCDLSCN